MSVLDIQFPTDISYGSSGGGGFLTRIIGAQSGLEYRSGAWSRTRAKYNVAHGLKTAAQYKALINFFYAVGQGRLNSFRFKDWLDYQDWGQGTLQLNQKGHLQLAKGYAFGGSATFYRFIDKPVTGSVVLSGSGTVNYTNGLVTSGGTAGDTWTGQFDVPVRFDIDELDMSIDQPDGSAGGGLAVSPSWRHIPIVEVKVPAP